MAPTTCFCGLIAIGKCGECNRWVCNRHSNFVDSVKCVDCVSKFNQKIEAEKQAYIWSLPNNPAERLMRLELNPIPHGGLIPNELCGVEVFAAWSDYARARGINSTRIKLKASCPAAKQEYNKSFSFYLDGWLFRSSSRSGHTSGDGRDMNYGVDEHYHIFITTDRRVLEIHFPKNRSNGPYNDFIPLFGRSRKLADCNLNHSKIAREMIRLANYR